MGIFDNISPYANTSSSRSQRMNVDIVFVIDATESMQPLIDTVRNFTLTFHETLTKALAEKHKSIQNLRTKVIVFRDYYIDDKDAMQESRFFLLPEESREFYDFVSSIREGGGGDEPESGLEALALAMQPKDFVADGEKRRHIIVLFTDASAHPFEQQQYGVPENYPNNMPQNMLELKQVWGEAEISLGSARSRELGGAMNYSAKRMVIFAPEVKPWTDIRVFSQVQLVPIDRGNGGAELTADQILPKITDSVLM